MLDSFTHRFLMTILAGFCAAGLVYFYRHFVLESMHSTGAGWRDMYEKPAQKR